MREASHRVRLGRSAAAFFNRPSFRSAVQSGRLGTESRQNRSSWQEPTSCQSVHRGQRRLAGGGKFAQLQHACVTTDLDCSPGSGLERIQTRGVRGDGLGYGGGFSAGFAPRGPRPGFPRPVRRRRSRAACAVDVARLDAGPVRLDALAGAGNIAGSGSMAVGPLVYLFWREADWDKEVFSAWFGVEPGVRMFSWRHLWGRPDLPISMKLLWAGGSLGALVAWLCWSWRQRRALPVLRRLIARFPVWLWLAVTGIFLPACPGTGSGVVRPERGPGHRRSLCGGSAGVAGRSGVAVFCD